MPTSFYKQPSETYTYSEFIDSGRLDEITYKNFSILAYEMKTTYTMQNIIDYYLDELKKCCIKVTEFSPEEIRNYKYQPDLLAYDVYGSTQLDFIILLCNGIIDPKEFDFKRKYLYLPKASILNEFLSRVYNSERDWLRLNASEINDKKLEEMNKSTRA